MRESRAVFVWQKTEIGFCAKDPDPVPPLALGGGAVARIPRRFVWQKTEIREREGPRPGTPLALGGWGS